MYDYCLRQRVLSMICFVFSPLSVSVFSVVSCYTNARMYVFLYVSCRRTIRYTTRRQAVRRRYTIHDTGNLPYRVLRVFDTRYGQSAIVRYQRYRHISPKEKIENLVPKLKRFFLGSPPDIFFSFPCGRRGAVNGNGIFFFFFCGVCPSWNHFPLYASIHDTGNLPYRVSNT